MTLLSKEYGFQFTGYAIISSGSLEKNKVNLASIGLRSPLPQTPRVEATNSALARVCGLAPREGLFKIRGVHAVMRLTFGRGTLMLVGLS